MLMLLSVHVTSVLFLVQLNNFALDYGLLLELHTLTLVARSYVLLVQCTFCWVKDTASLLLTNCTAS